MPESHEMFKTISKKTDDSEFISSVPKGYEKGKTKFIVITGTVISGVGKGTFSSSIGTLLKLFHGYKVSPVKFDGYLNYDAGTLNPFRHGEVFVLDDGTECDLDLGTYERMMNSNFSKDNYLTSGKIFKTIIDKERAGKYLGRDVQFIPHVTGEIKSFLRNLAVKSEADIIMVEVGGTVGDIENSYFLEAMRELAYEEGKENVCFITVTYILQPRSLGEHKSKAAQLGLKTLMGIGIQPDIIICRSENPVNEKIREKISIYSNVPVERVINCYDIDNIYKIPIFLQDVGIDEEIIKILKLPRRDGNDRTEYHKWKELVEKINSANMEVTVGIVGKYTSVHDSYLSILKAIEHTSPYLGIRPKIQWIEATHITPENVKQKMEGVDGIIVPGGFGERGTEGKIECIRYARENDIPFFGLCFGFQMAVIEFSRNVCGLKGANSTEIDDETPHPVIFILPEQEEIKGLGGTMRLGGFDLGIEKNTFAHKLYGKNSARERFRHRWNVNPKYIETLEKHGLVFSGRAPEKKIMQILELPGKRFFVGTQFHPELTSRPINPHPLFRGFLEACLKK
ncbi:MAG: CTP synthase [Candidatus Aenigmarchaeota archaeon]|nr:CTP synthase [Candidatus Aenigmarchaeota archaeon]